MKTNFWQHTIFNFVILSLLLLVGFLSGAERTLISAFALGFVTGTFWSPDVDVASQRKFFSLKKPQKMFFNLFVYLIWVPYSLVMPHRGLSHVPFVGTATRIGYLAAIFWILGAGNLPGFVSEADLNPFWFVAGWAMADISHLGLDHFGSLVSRIFGR